MKKQCGYYIHPYYSVPPIPRLPAFFGEIFQKKRRHAKILLANQNLIKKALIVRRLGLPAWGCKARRRRRVETSMSPGRGRLRREKELRQSLGARARAAGRSRRPKVLRWAEPEARGIHVRAAFCQDWERPDKMSRRRCASLPHPNALVYRRGVRAHSRSLPKIGGRRGPL